MIGIGDIIFEEMNNKEKGKIYTVSDFYAIGSKSSVKTALHRLTKEGKIHRMINGYYVIPYFSELLKEFSYPTANALANKIAEKYMWNICPAGDAALNQVGLSTQVPNVVEFISDGPYREIAYLNQTIKFKHVSNRTISTYSKSLCLTIESIKALKENNITQSDLQLLADYVSIHVEEDLIEDTKSVPEWIYRVLKKVEKMKCENQ